VTAWLKQPWRVVRCSHLKFPSSFILASRRTSPRNSNLLATRSKPDRPRILRLYHTMLKSQPLIKINLPTTESTHLPCLGMSEQTIILPLKSNFFEYLHVSISFYCSMGHPSLLHFLAHSTYCRSFLSLKLQTRIRRCCHEFEYLKPR